MSPSRGEKIDWWRICNHPAVQGLHRLITLIAAPLAVMLLAWAASAFDQMRLSVNRLEATMGVEFKAAADRTTDLTRRVEALEAKK